MSLVRYSHSLAEFVRCSCRILALCLNPVPIKLTNSNFHYKDIIGSDRIATDSPDSDETRRMLILKVCLTRYKVRFSHTEIFLGRKV